MAKIQKRLQFGFSNTQTRRTKFIYPVNRTFRRLCVVSLAPAHSRRALAPAQPKKKTQKKQKTHQLHLQHTHAVRQAVPRRIVSRCPSATTIPATMSSVAKKKVRNFLNARSSLQAQYSQLKLAAQNTPWSHDLCNLYDFDQLCYSFTAIRAYYTASKCQWDSDYRNLMDDFASVNLRIETQLPLADLMGEFPQLAVLRRELRENAHEGGKIAFLAISTGASTEWLAGVVRDAPNEGLPLPGFGLPRKRNRQQGGPAQKQQKLLLEIVNLDSEPESRGQSIGIAPEEPSRANTTATEDTPAVISIETSPAVEAEPIAPEQSSVVQTPAEKPPAIRPSPVPPAKATPPKAKPAQATPSKANSAQVTPSQTTPANATPVTQAKAAQPASPAVENPDVLKPVAVNIPTALVKAAAQTPSQSAKNGTTSTTPGSAQPRRPIAQEAPLSRTTHASHSEQQLGKSPVKKPQNSTTLGSLSKTQRENLQNGSNAASSSDVIIVDSDQKSRETSPDSSVARSSFGQFRSWTKEHVNLILASASTSLLDPNKGIIEAFKKRFDVTITKDAAETLRRHYGLANPSMKDYKFHIQAFHLVASSIYNSRAHYVTIPWQDLRKQYSRKTGIHLDDWEAKERYLLFLLHRRVYGENGEPISNFSDEVGNFQIMARLRSLNTHISTPTKIQSETPEPTSPIAFNTEQPVITGLRTWTPQLLNALIDSQIHIPPDTSNKLAVTHHYIRLITGVSLHHALIAEKLKSKDVMLKVQEKLRAKHAGIPLSAVKPETLSNTPAPTKSKAPTAAANVSPKAKADYFKLFDEMDATLKPDSQYFKQICDTLTEFWNFDRTKCIVSTIDYVSKIPSDTADATLRVARTSLITLIRLRLLRQHSLKVTPEIVSLRMRHLMQMDIFEEPQCKLINEVLEGT